MVTRMVCCPYAHPCPLPFPLPAHLAALLLLTFAPRLHAAARTLAYTHLPLCFSPFCLSHPRHHTHTPPPPTCPTTTTTCHPHATPRLPRMPHLEKIFICPYLPPAPRLFFPTSFE